MENAARSCRCELCVFILPPWHEIFANDPECRQSFDEAVRTYEAMVSVYRRMDYDLVELPCAPVVERVRLVIAAISAA